MARHTAFGLLLFGASPSVQASFIPFADVEELKPARLEPYCEKEVDEDGHRWCARSIIKTLEDDGEVHMSWKMHVNPDKILSLDTEEEHGVKVTDCVPGELEIALPDSHHHHAVTGSFVIGSHFVHGCNHLTKKHMYHKVTKVLQKKRHNEEGNKLTRFRLATELLPGFPHVAKFISFNFSYMPIEARNITKFPAMRTNFGQKKDGRRLGFFDDMMKKAENGLSGGNFQSAGQSSGGIETDDSVLNLSPKQISNFGWNWDFYMNDTESPRFVINKPGTKGSVIVRNPYAKAHAGCFINFTSNFQGIMAAPLVKWQAGYKGHGQVQGRLEGAMNSTRDGKMDPEHYKLPQKMLESVPLLHLLKEYDEPKWFHPINKAVGNMPMMIEPGFQFQVDFYHKGPFSGFLTFGGSAHGTMSPILHYDSEKGFESTCDTDLQDVDMWPPMWMIFTKECEMGLQARPTMLIRGDFMGFQGATSAIAMRPYMNVTIIRDGQPLLDVDKATTTPAFMSRMPIQPSVSGGRQLFSLGDPSTWTVNNTIDDSDPNCQVKDLHFNIGQGMMMRGEIRSMGVPNGMPGFPEEDPDGELPLFTTPWSEIGGAKPGQTLQDFLPKELCDAGLCDSYMPGCRKASFEKLHFPTIKFNYSRPYYFHEASTPGNPGEHVETHSMIKDGMAWAFSCMPEAITIALKEMEQMKKERQSGQPSYPWMQHAAPQQQPSYPWTSNRNQPSSAWNAPSNQLGAAQQPTNPWGGWGNQPAAPPQQTYPWAGNQQAAGQQAPQQSGNPMGNFFGNLFGNKQQPAPAPPQPQFNFGQQPTAPQGGYAYPWTQPQQGGVGTQSGQMSGAFGKWWNTQRRLSDKENGIPAPGELEKELEAHQVLVQFPGGLPYKVDHGLLDRMVKFGYFKGMFDDGKNHLLGELQITGFYLEEGPAVTIPVRHDESLQTQAVNKLAVCAAFLCIAGFVSLVIIRRKRYYGYQEAPYLGEQGGME